jgi:hypothetical protein
MAAIITSHPIRSNIHISFPFQNPIIMSYINADNRCREKIFQISQEKNLRCRLCKARVQFETPEDVAYTNADSIGRQETVSILQNQILTMIAYQMMIFNTLCILRIYIMTSQGTTNSTF